ncbi:MAG: hypothetical protein ABJN36_06395 [Cyclobacteriaceae bacterium]|uniref:hypothetical protein n=1 Tax=Nonlabens ulvanivorans TaxID=906888 RepID=UPI003272E943
MIKRFSLLLIIILSTQVLFAQSQDIYEKYGIYRSPFRVFINKFSWTLTTGYGLTNYKHNLAGYYFYQDNFSQQILRNDQELPTVFTGYTNWVSDPIPGAEVTIEDLFEVPYQYLPNPVNNPDLRNDQYLVDADSIDLSFANQMATIPILLSVHYNIKDWRLGLGFQYEKHFIKSLEPSVNQSVIRNYNMGFKSSRRTKWFGLVGYKFYEYWDYSFNAELQLGASNPGPQINTSAIGIGQKLFVNLGVSMERNLSEYFRIIVRPSYDFKRYTINIPDGTDIRHNNSAWLLSVGVSLNFPEIPRSPMESDHVQLKHVITDPKSGKLIEVRGQPIWKKQNPKVGENHRKLWRYKWRNKRKIDPY